VSILFKFVHKFWMVNHRVSAADGSMATALPVTDFLVSMIAIVFYKDADVHHSTARSLRASIHSVRTCASS
jgi:hypothetical protein